MSTIFYLSIKYTGFGEKISWYFILSMNISLPFITTGSFPIRYMIPVRSLVIEKLPELDETKLLRYETVSQ